MTHHLAQDPDERFDILDAHGRSTGLTKRRADVHRDGDWHRAIHVWIFGRDASSAFLMLQRRGMDKDTWPGKLDATAAGHLGAGESPQEAFREIDEELGIEVQTASLVHVGTRINVSEHPGWIDHELQDVYLLRDDRPLNAYQPNAREVDSVVRVDLALWTELLFGERNSLPATVLLATSRAVSETTIDADDPIPSIDGYFRRVAIACQRALANERHIAV